MDKTFYAMNMHGYELEKDYVIPKNCRVIMFCYSGGILDVCHRFDKYIWLNIFTDPNSTKNYKNFLKSLSGYSSLRDHFCVYESGTKIKDMKFETDHDFRHGLYKLPVQGAVCVEKNNKVYITDPETTAEYLTIPERKLPKCKNVVMDRDKAAKALRSHKNPAWIRSLVVMDTTNLSTVLKRLKFRYGGVTLLLLTCREGKGYDLPEAYTVGQTLLSL